MAGFQSARKPYFLAGQRATGDHVIEVRSPFDNSVLGSVCRADWKQLDAAVHAMQIALDESRGEGGGLRYRRCERLWSGLKNRAAEFAVGIAQEAGKPLKAARAEVDRGIATLRLAMEECTRYESRGINVDIDERSAGYRGEIRRFPLGPALFITPFNFPLNLVLHKVAPAVACGCPFLVKPSDRTPLTALLLGELLEEAELPHGAWSIMPATIESTQRLAADDRIKFVSFTGSAAAGWKIRQAAYKKEVVLELGNNSAVIVESGADLPDAARRIVAGAFGYAGQSCISVQRIYLHETIEAEMTRLLARFAEELNVGDPMDESTDVGPVIDVAAADRIEAWVGEAVTAGAKVLCGNRREGTLLWPILLTNVPADAKMNAQEVFGPVATIGVYRSFDDALAMVNASNYGLQAGIFTHDIRQMEQAINTLDVGGIIFNDTPTVRIDNMPYGGVKDSGIGREGARYAIDHMTYQKMCVWRG